MISIAEIQALAENPVAFIEEVLGSTLWGKQKQIAASVAENRTTAVKSCHGSGKTFLAARIALWWLFTRPYSTVITTAPTNRQVTELLWKEIRLAYKAAKWHLGGELFPKAPKLTIDDGWLLIGFSTDDPVNFQGWHASGGVLAIFDEAPGVPAPIWNAMRGVLVGDRDRLLVIGNPVEPNGPFFDLFQGGSATTFHISAYDVPNVVHEKDIFPGLATKQWVDEMKQEWGEGTPMWYSRVLGDFPDTDDLNVIPLSWINKAIERWNKYENGGEWSRGETMLGVDVARLGADKTVIAEGRQGLGVRRITKLPKQDTMATTGVVVRMIQETGAVAANVDADGIGAGVYDRLKEQRPQEAVEMRGGMKSSDPTRYFNLRAEWYWSLREKLNPDGTNPIALPPSETLKSQLSAVRWGLTSRGQVKIETKDEMKKRGLKSPDEADAVVYCMAEDALGFDIVSHLQAMTRL